MTDAPFADPAPRRRRDRDRAAGAVGDTDSWAHLRDDRPAEPSSRRARRLEQERSDGAGVGPVPDAPFPATGDIPLRPWWAADRNDPAPGDWESPQYRQDGPAARPGGADVTLPPAAPARRPGPEWPGVPAPPEAPPVALAQPPAEVPPAFRRRSQRPPATDAPQSPPPTPPPAPQPPVVEPQVNPWPGRVRPALPTPGAVSGRRASGRTSDLTTTGPSPESQDPTPWSRPAPADARPTRAPGAPTDAWNGPVREIRLPHGDPASAATVVGGHAGAVLGRPVLPSAALPGPVLPGVEPFVPPGEHLGRRPVNAVAGPQSATAAPTGELDLRLVRDVAAVRAERGTRGAATASRRRLSAEPVRFPPLGPAGEPLPGAADVSPPPDVTAIRPLAADPQLRPDGRADRSHDPAPVADGGTSTSLLPVRSRRRGSPPPREVADVPPAVSGPATGRLGTGSLTPPAGLTGSGGLGSLLGSGAGLAAATAGAAAGAGGAQVAGLAGAAGTAGTAAAGTLDAVVGLGRAGRAARSGRAAPPRAEGTTSAGEPPRPSLRAVATPPGDEPTSMLPPVPPDLPGGPGDPAPPSRSRRSDGRRSSGSTAALSAVPVSTTGSRAGRNLPAAIAVGLGLVGAILASLLVRKEAFVVLVAAAVVIALWELSGALAKKGVSVALVPLAVGAVGMLVSAFVAGEDGLLVSFTLTAFGVLLWRIIDGPEGAARDVAAGVFVAAYVPFLAGFAMLMLAAPDGPYRVIVFIAVTVANDVGGYASGVLFGRHPMAPSISPKKSWEGLAGSVVLCMIVGAGTVHFLLDGSLLAGVAVGAAAAFTATLGDLSESLVKRDLGIKDMGSLLPGHGGIMDRLDSLLPTAPAVALLLMLLVPVP